MTNRCGHHRRCCSPVACRW